MRPGIKAKPLSEEHKKKLSEALSGKDRGGKSPELPRSMPPKTKICYTCNEEKLVDRFHKHKQMRDGFINQCKECFSKVIRANKVKRHGSILEARRFSYKRELETGSRTRIAPQKYGKDLDSKRRSSKKYCHARSAKTKLRSEFDRFVFDEAARLCSSREIATGFKWSIDHIVPLNHALACGLHSALNFQVVPSIWNSAKSNKNMKSYFFNTK